MWLEGLLGGQRGAGGRAYGREARVCREAGCHQTRGPLEGCDGGFLKAHDAAGWRTDCTGGRGDGQGSREIAEVAVTGARHGPAWQQLEGREVVRFRVLCWNVLWDPRRKHHACSPLRSGLGGSLPTGARPSTEPRAGHAGGAPLAPSTALKRLPLPQPRGFGCHRLRG